MGNRFQRREFWIADRWLRLRDLVVARACCEGFGAFDKIHTKLRKFRL